ncbi:MAG: S8 family serine peptidase [Anaerolineae bacterium]|nr:S8 family serine peptidase [Anaerolineae bacterium]
MRSRSPIGQIIGALLLLATPLLLAAGPPATPGIPEVATHIVVFAEGADPGLAAEALARAHGLAVTHVYRHALRGMAAVVPEGRLEGLQRDPRVAYVEENVPVYLAEQVLPTGVDRIDADLSPVAGIDGVDTRVDADIAIIDTGVDRSHPDLNVAGVTDCAGPNPFRGSCKDGHGDDADGHGTHVAGIATALDNGVGVVGVAPGARIWAVKVFSDSGSGYLSWVIAGIDWVTARASDIEVANMSLSWGGNVASARTAIQNSVARGVVYVVAAGNGLSDVYGADGQFGTSDDTEPASYPEVATISALADFDGRPGGITSKTLRFSACTEDRDDSFACFSNYSRSVAPGNPVTSPGAAIDLMLPGVDILSTYKGGGYASMSGTSMASPHGAGLAALYIATHGRATNAAGVYAIRQALVDAGWNQNHLSGLTLFDDPDGNPERLGRAESGGSTPVDQPPTVSITDPSDGATVSGAVAVTAQATDDNGVTQVEFFVDGTSIGSDSDGSSGWSASWDTTAYTDVAYTVSATATDTAGQTASDSITVTVDNSTAPPPSDAMHVGDLDGSTTVAGRNWKATVTVTVHDAGHAPVASAAVTGTWSDGYSGSASCTTGAGGQCSVSTGAIKSVPSVTLTVTGVSRDGLTYDAGSNHDPDGDSSGTTISVNRP